MTVSNACSQTKKHQPAGLLLIGDFTPKNEHGVTQIRYTV